MINLSSSLLLFLPYVTSAYTSLSPHSDWAHERHQLGGLFGGLNEHQPPGFAPAQRPLGAPRSCQVRLVGIVLPDLVYLVVLIFGGLV